MAKKFVLFCHCFIFNAYLRNRINKQITKKITNYEEDCFYDGLPDGYAVCI